MTQEFRRGPDARGRQTLNPKPFNVDSGRFLNDLATRWAYDHAVKLAAAAKKADTNCAVRRFFFFFF